MNDNKKLLTAQIRMYTGNGIPKLITAAELAGKVYMSAEKILELAKNGFFPCVMVEGRTEPLFLQKNTVEYVKNELFHIQEGKPYEIHVHADNKFGIEELPRSLHAMRDQLFKFGFLKIPCIYFLVLANEVVYVGQSINLNQRVSAHLPDKHFDKIFYMPTPERDLSKVETRMIELLKPKYNRANYLKDNPEWLIKTEARLTA